ncbi:hypothetical protein FBUS_09771 [Fasciolopsis buskii]|uniref:DnaJ homolog subfamily B member 9 n=1 Tax=Fasciolopsis buskii TaxID=27845 RepID=A0A8E0VMI0_9TREM|nr:hypothetical protein FBUS_09771 [Fasciolopsis buski]
MRLASFFVVLVVGFAYCAKEDLYRVLKIDRGATLNVIKRQFRKLAAENHPDRNKGPEAKERYNQIAEAYEVYPKRIELQYFDLQPKIRRSFARELLALIPNLDTEFSGQIKLLSFDEMNTNEVLLEITPLKGYYAHASFVFRIRATPNYPFQLPAISCLSNVFHPNIGTDTMEGNVCLNLFANWCPRYGLEDLLNALLFLFYEPNFDEFLNGNVSVSENAPNMKQTIWKSLYGGFVNEIWYDPNAAWIQWVEGNGNHPFRQSSTKECFEQNILSTHVSLSLHQQPTTNNYYKQAISGQNTSAGSSIRFELPGYFMDEAYLELSYIRHITMRPINLDCDTVDAVKDLRRYYYLEQCNYNQEERMKELDLRSVTASTVEHYQYGFDSKQSAVFGFMISQPIESSCSDRYPFIYSRRDKENDFIFDLKQQTSQENLYFEPFLNGHPSPQEQPETAAELPHKISDGAAALLQGDTGMTVHELQMPENISKNDRDKLSATCFQPDIGGSSESTSSPVEPSNVLMESATSADELRYSEEDQWESTAKIEAENQDTISDPDSEELECAMDVNHLRRMLQSQEKSARQLWPWWWIVYQSRWPAYLAPRHITQVRRTRQRYDFVRASSVVLRSDLFRLGMSCDRTSVYLLLDSLSLSPFSPILNRAAASRMSGRKIVTWYGLDWYSVSDVFRPIHTHQSIDPRNHFHIPILPFTLFYLHNWIAYMSRVELYGSSLGYSRPRNPGALTSMASTCLTPANLGCGQCCYADGWPLWLLWRVSRWLCRLLATSCSRSIRGLDKCDPSSVKIAVGFPFSDLDEI